MFSLVFFLLYLQQEIESMHEGSFFLKKNKLLKSNGSFQFSFLKITLCVLCKLRTQKIKILIGTWISLRVETKSQLLDDFTKIIIGERHKYILRICKF